MNKSGCSVTTAQHLPVMTLGCPMIEVPAGFRIVIDTIYRRSDTIQPDTSSEWRGNLLEDLGDTGEYAGISHASYLLSHQDEIPESYRNYRLAFLGTVAEFSDYRIVYIRWDSQKSVWVSYWDYPIFALCPNKYPEVVFLRLVRD